MSNNIQLIGPDSELYDRLSGSLQATKRRKQATTLLYNEIAAAYNRCEVEGFVIVEELKNKRISNLQKVFLNRGLKRRVDYEFFRPSIDEEGNTIPKAERRTLIKRLTEALMRVV